MRILHAIQELRTGGAERVVVALAKGAAAEGHEVAVASAPGSLVAEIDGPHFTLPLVERRPWRLPGTILAVRRAVRGFGPDLVHCHNPGVAAAAGPATFRGRRPHALVSVHGVPDEDYRRAALVLRLAGLPVVACGPGVELGLEAAGLQPLTTILNGVAPAPPPADRPGLAAEWGIAPDRPLVLAVGRLVPVKNHELAIRALSEVPDATLAIVGEGLLLDDLRRSAVDAGVADRVVFAGLRPDARELIGAADVVVLPSRAEGLPLVALEAFAAGTPLVATAVRGVQELVGDDAALLVPPGDPDTLAAGLRLVLADPPLADRLSAAGRKVAAEHSEEAMIAAYLDLYERLAPRG
jgi:glycosyltransferase involved in cell wall biosynthesis